ncbi:MAG: ATP-binding protein [Desulfobacteraceae bacterium]|nr:ATP-binding protein [Desulfobacteraceae bacterium]
MNLLYQEAQAVLEAIPDCITLHTPDLKIVWANREAGLCMGTTQEKLLSHSCCEVFTDCNAPAQDCPVAKTFKDQRGIHQADMLILDRYWDIRTVYIAASNGELPKVIRVARDITQTRHLEQQLRQSQKMEAIGTLAGGIAHDFNNILAAILGFDELSLQHPRLDPDIRPNLQEIFKASLRAKALVQQIMDFSHQGKPHVLPLKLESVVTEAMKLLRPALPSTIVIETRLTSRCIVEADPDQMQQVVVNLCTNAAQAMSSKGGTLAISLEDIHLDPAGALSPYHLKPGDYVCLKVQDSGAGMTPEVIERIFEPYFTTREVGRGSGLGLAVAHGIVKGHNGAIAVESMPDKGSTFTVCLPAVVQNEERGSRSAMVGDCPGGAETILFVDDEQILAGLGEQILRRLGYSVKTCTNPEYALALIQADPQAFDLLMSDLTMPEMSGLELAEACKEIRPDLPVVICTGHADLLANDQNKADQLGIHNFILKPARLQDMAATIRRVLDGVAAR